MPARSAPSGHLCRPVAYGVEDKSRRRNIGSSTVHKWYKIKIPQQTIDRAIMKFEREQTLTTEYVLFPVFPAFLSRVQEGS